MRSNYKPYHPKVQFFADLILWPVLMSMLVGLAYINPNMAMTWLVASMVMTWMHR